jgi:hypothetical protein
MSNIGTLIDRLSDRQRREFALWCAKRAAAWAAERASAGAATGDAAWDAAWAAAWDAEGRAQSAELERMLAEAKP